MNLGLRLLGNRARQLLSRWSLRGPALAVSAATCLLLAGSSSAQAGESFKRIASFVVASNNCPADLNDGCWDDSIVGEIIAASDNGGTLVYIGTRTDADTEVATGNVGFVDIANPHNPTPIEVVDIPSGLPTSVAVRGDYAVVAVNTSANFVMVSGELRVYSLSTRALITTIALQGQPDSVAVSPDQRYIAVVIENERDEDEGDGAPPQLPSGLLEIVDSVGAPGSWTTRQVSLVGIADKFPNDAEPEFVDINSQNVAVVTLQENNHVVLVKLSNGKVIGDFPAGVVDLDQVDTDDNSLIEFIDTLSDVPREPDAVNYISANEFATSDEGDLDGGSRGFTIFRKNGKVLFTSGNDLEHIAARLGHYPEGRSDNKGNEPEGIEYAEYGGDRYLFVGSERSSVTFVYKLPAHFGGGYDDDRGGSSSRKPELVQVLPGGLGPEGLVAIPMRDLFVTISENDARGDGFRSIISIYELGPGDPTYPTIQSADRPDGTPIPWAALSALAADRTGSDHLFTVHDSFFDEARLYKVDVSQTPALIQDEIVLLDGGSPPVDLDIEGLVVRSDGSFWAASEGAGSVDDPNNPFEFVNLLLEVAANGTVLDKIKLPKETNDLQRRFGFEGVARTGTAGVDELVYVAFQRGWVGDPPGHVRIGRYDPVGVGEDWTFFYYPLDTPLSPNGGWVGLSEIVAVDADTFAVVERDNQSQLDAVIKRIYQFDLPVDPPQEEGGVFPLISKTLVRDLLVAGDLPAGNGVVIEKVEGLTILPNGDTYIATDNDGVDDFNGETQLINLGPYSSLPTP